MQEHTPINAVIPKMTRTPFYFSLTLLFLIGALIVWLTLYMKTLDTSIETYRSTIAEKKNQIAEISKDRNVILTKIEQSNAIRPSIDLQGIVRDFYDAASRANVRFKGFSISNDVISTTLSSTTPDGIIHPDAAGTIIKMMREYDAGRGGKFSLEPISAISGDPTLRTTSIQFKVISTPIK